MLNIKRLLFAALAVGMVAAQCDEDIEIQSDGDVSQLDSCSRFDGSINIKKGVANIIFPTSVSSITGDLIIDGAVGLTGFSAPGLKTIGGSFKLNGLTVLSTLSCPELVSVGDIAWSTLPALQSLSFTKKVSKANTVLITDTLLTSLEGINLVTAERFNINNNRYLRSVNVALGNVTDVLIIEANGKGVNASFPNLKWANNITVRDAGDVYFPVLEEVKSTAAFVNNTFETVSFPELTQVGESLAFVSCSRLTKISANELEEVGGTFQLANNTKLAVVEDFDKLAVVGGAVDISGVVTNVTLPSLDDVRGGFNLQSTEDVSCDEFNDLKSSGVIKGDDFTCAGKKETAESKTGGLGTAGSGSTDNESAAATFGASMLVAFVAGVAAMVAL
ncbi:hypothetical protein BZA05DRAFT_387547 [Tricharina praecox]|uniref:uncharacterized protein n=1 Tax=Tricharina praecox TaxID=43433 RepID=UPI00222069DD|nr:uncharacterized protein BZA05DRAFT_387547 [Tricharina praecox]KAI5857196.1 hypothetical protein BZA05DRAFT_387547 [Tricharina praecox]